MKDFSSIVQRGTEVFTVLRQHEEWGIRTLDLVRPPRRFWADQDGTFQIVEQGVDANRVRALPIPTALLQQLPEGDTWAAQSKRSVARLFAYYLVSEDPQRRLDARQVITLSHQVSLVRHILDHDDLRRVLIADEVGLGKTVEAGLLIKELLEASPGLRVLYLAPARLVNNVGTEFDRLDLHFRRWKSGEADARLSDPRIIASIHRAVHRENFKKFVETGPWDVIVVDECHHLSDWAEGGGDPVLKFRLVRDLVARQRPDSRLILMSGTPHQGHLHRFDNLLRLLRRDNETEATLSGRVIYRTKEDVQDWHGNPLFPIRQINEPLVLDLGPEYKAWLQRIHDFYKPTKDDGPQPKSRHRAAGWRCAQALQWAASSPHAGLGYLARQAVRATWNLSDGVLAEALAALRPYRNGPATEPLESLFARIRREIRQQVDDNDIEDLEEDYGTSSQEGAEREELNSLLVEGLGVLKSSANRKWEFVQRMILDRTTDDKVVLFAQPIETVCALARFLEHQTGEKVALIIGGQTDAERKEQQDRFWRKDGPRFLVSSRAGGEGINLQIARWLVHIDVPWNPMELEQRVGRVHRFGSKRTIIVDTIVVKDSREADAFRVAREKLKLVASTVVGRERFESVFSRVMCLIPPEELQDVLIEEAASPLKPEDQEKIAGMIESGFKAWKQFHEQFSTRQKEIHAQDPGLADWQDVKDFVTDHGAAETHKTFTATRFRTVLGKAEPEEEVVETFRLTDSVHYFVGDYGGAMISGSEGERVTQLGLNLPVVGELLRKFAFPTAPTGAAHLRWPQEQSSDDILDSTVNGVLIFLRQVIRPDQKAGWTEVCNDLDCFLVRDDRTTKRLEGVHKGTLLRNCFKAGVRIRVEENESLINAMKDAEQRLTVELRRPIEEEIRQGIRYAVTPLFAGIITR